MLDITYKVLLVKAEWCGHCKHFLPIFAKANKEIKKNTDKDIQFISYDTQTKDLIHHDEDDKNDQYKNKSSQLTYPYSEEIGEVDGFPTIFVIIENNNNNEKKILKDVLETRGNDYAEFNKIVLASFEKLESNNNSDNKSETIFLKYNHNQSGGNKNKANKNYESKYLKYKSKYIELKNNLNK